MPKAEGKIYKFDSVKKIQTSLLEVIQFKSEGQEITMQTKEFSAVCPFSGLPDVATLEVMYIPNDCIVELKSLKYYLTSFRSVGIYQEAVNKRIYQDLKRVLNPKRLRIKTLYNTRGGIDTLCINDSEKETK